MSKRYRTYATTLFTPARHTRRERHVRSKAPSAVVTAARRRAKDEKHSRAKALADEREAAHYLPRAHRREPLRGNVFRPWRVDAQPSRPRWAPWTGRVAPAWCGVPV